MFDPTQFYLNTVAQERNNWVNSLQNFQPVQDNPLQQYGDADFARIAQLVAAKRRAQQAATPDTSGSNPNFLTSLATLIGAGLRRLF